MRYAIEQEKYIDAFRIFDALLNGDLLNTTAYFYNVTGIKNYFNYLMSNEPEDQGYFIPFVTRADRRKQIHVGNLSYGSQSETVEQMLLNDVVGFAMLVFPSPVSSALLDAKHGLESCRNRQCELQRDDLQRAIGHYHCRAVDHVIGLMHL